MKRMLAVATAGCLVLALAPMTSAAAANPVITVDLGSSTGAVTNGATGFLYGLANPGIPSDNVLAALHPNSTAQMAPDGTQHPSGDALKVAPQFVADGGGNIEIYMQDYYPTWPYTNPGITSYLSVVAAEAQKVVADPNRSHYVYVPFNEPDGIWYSGNLTGLENDWKLAYQKIRSIDSTARIAGPNYSSYNATDYKNFLQFARDNNVLPDITTWHELQNSFFTNWYSNISSYRASEVSLGISPRPVNINEYGRSSGDLGVPGNLVQFMTRFENSKVTGNLAFWTDSGALDDLVANYETNRVVGGWWLYKWYGELTGNTVTVTPPTQNGSLQALATYDANKTQARVILGGSLNPTDVFSTDVAFQHIPTALGSTVHATVWGVDNSGTSASAEPYVAAEGDYAVSTGRAATVTLTGLKALSAYEVILTPNTDTSAASANRYEAEYASLTGSAKVTYGTNTGYSGTYFVEGYGTSSTAGTNFVVNAPSDGYYNVALRYSAGPIGTAPANRTTRLTLNGANAKDVALPGTANWNTWNTVTTKLYLQAGINRIGYRAFTSDDSDAINIDYIDVAATTGTVGSYEAESSANTRAGTAAVVANSAASGGSYVGNIGLGAGNTLTFNGVTAAAAGTYDVVIQYANSEYAGSGNYNTNSINRYADISVNGGAAVRQFFRVTGSWSTYRTTVLRVQLNAGSNTVKFSNAAAYAPDIDKILVAAVVG